MRSSAGVIIYEIVFPSSIWSKLDSGIGPSLLIAINFCMTYMGLADNAAEGFVCPADHLRGSSSSTVIILLAPTEEQGFVLMTFFLSSSAVSFSGSGNGMTATVGPAPNNTALPSWMTPRISCADIS